MTTKNVDRALLLRYEAAKRRRYLAERNRKLTETKQGVIK